MHKNILIALSAIALLAACGEDKKEECTGHGCITGSRFELPEGGEARIIVTTFYDGNPVKIDAQALFFKDQEPLSRPLAGAKIAGIADACEDWSSGDIFDNGPTAKAMDIVASREYVDAGASVEFKQGSRTWTLPKKVKDMMGSSVDQANFLEHPFIYYYQIPEGELVTNQNVRVPLDLGRGEDPLGVAAPADPSVLVPADFALTSPTLANDPNGLNVTFPAGQDVVFTSDGVATSGDNTDITFIAFIDPNDFSARGQCLTGPGERSYTVPRAMIDRMMLAERPAMGSPDGYLLVGEFVHRAYEFEGRRLDLLGINCHFFGWRSGD
jgi:hypothetical protein